MPIITDFELQRQSGQLWLDIQERLAAKDATIAAITAERDALAAVIANAKTLHVSGDHAALEALFTEAEKSDAQKARDAAQAELDAAQAAADAAKAKLDALA